MAWNLFLCGILVISTFLVAGCNDRQNSQSSKAASISGAKRSSDDCKECHKREYDLWAESNHALAERSMQPDLDNAAFAPEPEFKHGSQTSTARIQNGEFQIVTMGFQTNVEAYRVDRVIGRTPLRQFLTAAPGGRWQVHEASYDPRSNDWFNVYGDDRKTGEWGHWTGRGMNWNSRCAECHNTGLQKNYDEATDSYQTTMTEMSVGCEACHGNMESHAQWRRTHTNDFGNEPHRSTMTPIRIVGLCGTCHSRQDSLTGEFQPGDSFFDHYSLETLDQAGRWYPDGQIYDEDYEFASLLSSKMNQRGIACMNCHDMHSMKNVVTGNDLCMNCHSGALASAPRVDPAGHGHHKLAEAGGQCVGCHMPTTPYMQRHYRHDHGFTIPDPLLTKDLEIPNACNRCHADKTVDWSLEYVNKWYGDKMNRHTRDRARWIAAAQKGEAAGKDKLVQMLAVGQESPYWRGVACGLLWQWANEPQVKSTLLKRLKDEHPFVREKAVCSLGDLIDNGNADVIAAVKPLLNDPTRNVRVASAWAFKVTIDTHSKAGQELQKELDFNADQPIGQYRKAMFQLARKQPAKALEHLQRAIARDPFSPAFRCEIARVFNQTGQPQEAISQLRVACQLSPQSAKCQIQLGQTLAATHQLTEAVTAFQEAAKLEPQNGEAWLNLGASLGTQRKPEEALAALIRAETILSNDPRAPYLRATVYASNNRYNEARNALTQALALNPNFKPALDLMKALSPQKP